ESMRAIEEQLRNTQKQSEEIIKTFISQGSLCSSLLIIAALAAVSEELLFRSVIQKALIKLFKNAHVAIVVTAFVFSAVHMDFFGFFPRFILGIMLGYMFWMSGSILPSMLMHFVNNATIVMLYYLNTRGFSDIDAEHFGSTDNVLVIILSLITTVAIFITCNRFKNKTTVISTETE
ncbi:MAG: CPBP family intramembrane metalloprotease, partial [Bacteroidales bacterium]|nr:CPBP family intramembrane metalloprotease [Bacteroidales bacterium]